MGSRSATRTLQPSSEKRLEIASPKPEPPPVTMATLPWRRVLRGRLVGVIFIELCCVEVWFEGEGAPLVCG